VGSLPRSLRPDTPERFPPRKSTFEIFPGAKAFTPWGEGGAQRRMRGNFPQAAACLRPHQSPAVTAVPLFVTYGDISPRRGENLSLPGEAFRGKLISVFFADND